MCLSCGCGIPDDDHGDPRNITKDDLKAAANAAGIEVEDVVVNLEDTLNEDFIEALDLDELDLYDD